MATRKQLAERWAGAAGRGTLEAAWAALESRSMDELRRLTGSVLFAEDVFPALDLRGFPFKELVALSGLDLSLARLDHAVFGGNLVDCRLFGAVLDGADAHNLSLKADFNKASFAKARLKGASFLGAVLAEANLREAKLESARLKGVDCRKALFIDAKLRLSHCAGADFRGADLRGADLSGASLGGVLFDEGTRLDGAVLTDAAMGAELRSFARGAGAVFGMDARVFERAVFDAVVVLLKERNGDGRFDAVLSCMASLRSKAGARGFDWEKELARRFPPEIMDELAEIVRQAGSEA